jgi:hypothetical protein
VVGDAGRALTCPAEIAVPGASLAWRVFPWRADVPDVDRGMSGHDATAMLMKSSGRTSVRSRR